MKNNNKRKDKIKGKQEKDNLNLSQTYCHHYSTFTPDNEKKQQNTANGIIKLPNS